MILFDTHFHYYREYGPSEYFAEAEAEGVKYMLAAGGGYKETLDAQYFASQNKNCWFAAGVHPHGASEFNDDIMRFAEFRKDEKLVAVGEIGLDYYYEHSEKKKQLDVFAEFLAFALECKLPAIIHCRDKEDSEEAYFQAYNLLSAFAGRGGHFVVHCFTGSVKWAEKFLELGAYIGITGIITFPKAENVRDVLKMIPEKRLLLETDAPYLAPIPHRGKKNHPKYLKGIALKAASVLKIDFDQIAELTTANAFSFFKIPQHRK
ncbi:MAG: hypothetical protein A2017_00455 [Lentisphaerae bacterium GWF2_44_16]|nr:MAG: hypothetical protein A2017_00455 [Lentisphaerae bacterium GWF2_44_16]